MLISFRKAKMALGVLPLLATLGGTPRETPQRTLRIRVSQETSPGAGNFDSNVLGFIEALNFDGLAADFYMFGKVGPNYGNTEPILPSNTSHLFFVNSADGLALFVVHNTSNNPQASDGSASVRFDLSGGTASILKDDDEGEADRETQGGTVFTAQMNWAGANTDGMVIGALPVGFTILGQFMAPPRGLGGGWEVISADGSIIPLQLVPGQRVRLDVHLVVDVQGR